MEVNKVLQHLVKWDRSLPAIKLAWNCELDLEECDIVPKISPSHYKSEILLSTSERYSLLCHQQRKFEFHKSGFEIIAIPSIVVFQNYEIGQKYSTRLTLRNVGKISQKATFFMDESNGFSFEEGSNRIAKFAPGMAVTIAINFVPEGDTDYYHKIVVSTKKSRFSVPILGIGTRGIIELPDVFDFGQVPVKVLKKKCVMAYNTGLETARFTLTTDGCFSVKPERGVVPAKDSFPFEISFIADSKQDYEGYVLIKYDNDEEVHCVCKANAVDADVSLSPKKFIFEDTYMGLKSRCTMVIYNNSDEVLDYKWMKFRTTSVSSPLEENGDGDSTRVKWRYAIGSSGGESRRHIGEGAQSQTSEIPNGFYHENFIIEPLLGKIQPRSSVDILAVFTPIMHYNYHVNAYLSLTGLQDVVNVPITGTGLAPKFQFAFQELDIGLIYLGGSHAYEIAVVNTSQIEGTLRFDKVITPGKHVSIKVEPEKMTLAPEQYGAFYLHLVCCGDLGDFVEKIRFSVLRANHQHVISIRGKKAFPDMHFSVPELDFGEVAYSFPKSKQILLINDSLNTVATVIGITETGTDEPIDFNQLLETHRDTKTDDEDPIHTLNTRNTMKNCKEFIVEPITFSLQPRGFQRITVTICGNSCRKIVTELALSIAIRGKEDELSAPLMKLPIRAHCKTPTLHNADPALHLKDAFLHFSNSRELFIRNPTNLSGCYYIVPVASQAESVKSDWTKLVGIAKPKSVTHVPFTFTPSNPGESTASYDLYVLGNKDKVTTLTVGITAVAAKLAVSSKKIEFGDIDLLSPSVQKFDIINESPLTIPFTLHMMEGAGENGDLWEFEPEGGIIVPDSLATIEVTVTLKEVGVHNALARVQMQEAANFIDIHLRAVGVGTGFVFNPSWDNPAELDFGSMFTKTAKSFTIEITNMGYCPKMLQWIYSKDDPPVDETAVKRLINRPQKGVASKNKKKPAENKTKEPTTTFTISPQRKILAPMASAIISFTASSFTPQFATEEYNLWSCTPREPPANKRVYEKRVPRRSKFDINNGIKPYQESYRPMLTQALIMSAHFETPKLVFSRKSMNFQIDAFPSQTDFMQEDVLKIENKGSLAIAGHFQTLFPFSMKMKYASIEDATTSWTHTFAAGEQFLLTVVFDGQHLRKDRGSYRFDADLTLNYVGHTAAEKETIQLKGEVNFPQVEIDRDVFELGIIGNGAEAVEEFSVTNPCNFCLTYKWYIKPRSTEIVYEPGELDKLCFELECEDNIRSHNTSRRDKRKRKRDKQNRKSKEEIFDERAVGTDNSSHNSDYQSAILVNVGGSSPNHVSDDDEGVPVKSHRKMPDWNHPPKAVDPDKAKDPSKMLDHFGNWVQFVRNKFFRSRMLETVGLHDIFKEKEDESNYLTFNKVEPKTVNNFAISQLIDIVPLAGIIQAGQTQNFVLVFYGHSNVKLKTTALCYIEGGTSRSIQITAQSTHLEDIEQVDSEEEIEPSPAETVISETKEPSVEKIKKVSPVPVEDVESSVHELIDNFKHRCAVRPAFLKKKNKNKK